MKMPKHNNYSPAGVFALGLVLALGMVALSGCAAVHTSIAKRELDVQTQMSDTVFLDPVSPDKKIIFIQVRNTSDQPTFDVESSVKNAITARGYRFTSDPDGAHYWLLANVLNVAKSSPTAAQAALHAGFGGALGGAALGAGIGGATHGWTGAGYGGLVGGLVGGAVETVANAAVKDVTYMVVTDIEISEKAKGGVLVREDTKLDRKQGVSGAASQTSSEVTDRKRYRTRIVSTANKVNLKYEEAAPALNAGIVRSLSGLF